MIEALRVNPAVRINFDLKKIRPILTRNLTLAMRQIAARAQRESKHYAPRSPETLDKFLNGKRIKIKRKNTRRRTRGKHLAGTLERSIESKVIVHQNDFDVCVFVSSNAPAKRYAHIIHDYKGVRWFRRGRGTVKKGPKADEKYILRAIKDNENLFVSRINKAVEQAFKKGIKK